MHPTYFPTAVPCYGASLPSTGSSPVTSSPASTVLSRRSDSLPFLSPRFVSFAQRYHGNTRLFSSLPSPPRVKRRTWSWSPGISGRDSLRGNARASQVPGEPDGPSAHVLRPRSDGLLLTKTQPPRGPRQKENEDSDVCPLSRLHSMAFGLAVYASQRRLPGHHARLASGCRLHFAGRVFLPAGFR